RAPDPGPRQPWPHLHAARALPGRGVARLDLPLVRGAGKRVVGHGTIPLGAEADRRHGPQDPRSRSTPTSEPARSGLDRPNATSRSPSAIGSNWGIRSGAPAGRTNGDLAMRFRGPTLGLGGRRPEDWHHEIQPGARSRARQNHEAVKHADPRTARSGMSAAKGRIGAMPLLDRVRTGQVFVGPFCHGPGEPAASGEWWQQPCIALTTFGSWEVRSRRGKGEVTPSAGLVSEGGEHDCRHPGGVDDRMLCVLYLGDIDPGPMLLVPQRPALHLLRKSL